MRLVRDALERGVSFFDTADAYGNGESERLLGRALRDRRHDAYIATKAGYIFRERSPVVCAARPLLQASQKWLQAVRRDSRAAHPQSRPGRPSSYGQQDFSPRYLRRALEASLRRLRTDFVDMYQLHAPRVVHDDVLALMGDLQSEGKIGGFGVGFEGLQHAVNWIETGMLSGIQVPFGVLDPQAGDDVIPRAAMRGIPVIVRGVLAGGFVARSPGGDVGRLRPGQSEQLAALRDLAAWTGVSPIQLALWFAAVQPGVSTVLVGLSSSAHLSEVVDHFQTPPPEHVLLRMTQLVRDSGGYNH
jgi:aryl-alcohol dehydrogenase-like predicted oxidoreductase